MSFRSKHRWTRRIILGLAFGVIAAPAQALPAESTSPELGVRQAPQPKVINYLSHGMTGEAVKSSHAGRQPRVINYLSHGMTAADAQDPRSGIPFSAGIPVPGDLIVPGEPKFGVVRVESAENGPIRPDDRADRFVPGATPDAPVSDGEGFAIDNRALFGMAALAVALTGFALAQRRRPRLVL
jgi:hypothetical protein